MPSTSVTTLSILLLCLGCTRDAGEGRPTQDSTATRLAPAPVPSKDAQPTEVSPEPPVAAARPAALSEEELREIVKGICAMDQKSAPTLDRAVHRKVTNATWARANAYIISKVGRRYFRSNYKPLRDQSFTTQGESFLHYDYLPLSQLKGCVHPVFVRMFARKDYEPRDYVASVNGGDVRAPVITAVEALRISQKQSWLGAADASAIRMKVLAPNWMRKDVKNWTWHLFYSTPTGSDCSTTSSFLVDMVTGEHATGPNTKACK